MKIPPELIEHILSFVPCDKANQSLFPLLARVCRAWTPAAEMHLYRHVLVHRKHQWRRLRQALQAHPHLRPLVRALQFADVHVELGVRSHAFGAYFPKLEEAVFCKDSTSVPVLRELVDRTLLHRLALVATASTWKTICQFFTEDETRWSSIKLDLPPFWATTRELNLGSISVRRLEITELLYLEYADEETWKSGALGVLRHLRLPDTTELAVGLQPFPDYSNAIDIAELVFNAMPVSTTASVCISLSGWAQVVNSQRFQELFPDVARRGELTVNIVPKSV